MDQCERHFLEAGNCDQVMRPMNRGPRRVHSMNGRSKHLPADELREAILPPIVNGYKVGGGEDAEFHARSIRNYRQHSQRVRYLFPRTYTLFVTTRSIVSVTC